MEGSLSSSDHLANIQKSLADVIWVHEMTCSLALSLHIIFMEENFYIRTGLPAWIDEVSNCNYRLHLPSPMFRAIAPVA
jgi:hypothetical protein